jgi:hypothetical protein
VRPGWTLVYIIPQGKAILGAKGLGGISRFVPSLDDLQLGRTLNILVDFEVAASLTALWGLYKIDFLLSIFRLTNLANQSSPVDVTPGQACKQALTHI